MANQAHLDILKQGLDIWNKWRLEHLDVEPDLSDTDLSDANLSRVNFSRVNLSKTNLSRAVFRGANLTHANLTQVDFTNADLYTANLNGANLSDANLNNTDLSGARLISANLSRTILGDTILIGTQIGLTIFGELDLRTVKGLNTVDHVAPSTIGIDTIYRSGGNIPETFLKGAGVDDTFITYIRSLVGKPIEYYTCFISYSSKDEAFTKRLYADLQSNNVRCWFAPEDMKIGDKIRPRIDEPIRIYDKLLLVLSEHSVASKWVEFEVEAAMDKEQEGKPPVLFPVRLDNSVMESTTAWAAHIKRMRHIGDFTSWKNHDEYQKAFKRLLRDLKSETKGINE